MWGHVQPSPVAGVLHLVLRVVAVLVDVDVEHHAGVRDADLRLLLVRGGDGEVLREDRREDAPDPVGVELERLAELLDERARLLDDVGAGVRHDARHLHAVPPRALAHHVAVERVEDALVRELERVVQRAHRLGLQQRSDVVGLLGLGALLPPLLVERLVLVAAVAERAHRVDVEWVLALARRRHPLLHLGHVRLLVRLLAEVLEPRAELLVLLARVEVEERPRVALLVDDGLVLELVADVVRLGLAGGEDLAAPHPLERPLAVRLGAVVDARRAHLLRHGGGRLQPVGEDDVRVHCSDVEVVDDRRLLALGVVAELAEAGCDLFLDLVVVGDLGEGDAALVLDRVLQSLVEAVEEALWV